MKRCSGVFEGGGVRGIGHVGAAWEFERQGFTFVKLAGSSAGAIVAALLAAGYSGKELKQEMESLDYSRLKGRDFLDYFGAFGKMCSILIHFGIYHTDYLEGWVEKLLDRKGIRTFHDVTKTGRTLKITVSDLTAGHLLVLPDDLAELGIAPGSFSVAQAVRMSVSIPIFFEPVKLKDRDGRVHLMVDGGLLSNFPLWVLDDGSANQRIPTFGFQFHDDEAKECPCACPSRWNLADYLKAIAATCMDATDYSRSLAGDRQRTVQIPVKVCVGGTEKSEGKGNAAETGKAAGKEKVIHAVDFDLSKEESAALFENGRRAAAKFLKGWNFADWERTYREPAENGK